MIVHRGLETRGEKIESKIKTKNGRLNNTCWPEDFVGIKKKKIHINNIV